MTTLTCSDCDATVTLETVDVSEDAPIDRCECESDTCLDFAHNYNKCERAATADDGLCDVCRSWDALLVSDETAEPDYYQRHWWPRVEAVADMRLNGSAGNVA